MSETSNELINVDPSASSASARGELRQVALVYWGHLAKWLFLLIVLALASVLMGSGPPDLVLYEAGFAAVILCAVAAFPAGIAVAMHNFSVPHAPVRVLLGSTLLITLVAIVLNGFVIPTRVRAGHDDFAWDNIRPGSVTLTGVREVRLALLRRMDDLIASRTALQRERRLNAALRGIDGDERGRVIVEHAQMDERIKREINLVSWRIQAVEWRSQMVVAAALLPLLSSWLGFLTGRWSTLARPGMQRQLFKWTVALCAVWSSGYTVLTGFISRGYQPQGPAVQAFPHFVLLPTLLLVLLGVSWLIIGRRIAHLAPH